MIKIQSQIKETTDQTEIALLNEKFLALDQELFNWDKQNLGPPSNWTGWNTIPPKVREYIQRMVDTDPAKRPTAAEAASFFRSLTPEDLVTPSQPTQAEPITNIPAGYSGDQSEPASGGYRTIGYTSDESA